ncbi:solute carrier family 22 member 11 [Chlorocebus sabaeus]|uniref:Solute carrier family 22 member 12 n=3 Tax=Cercopithecinae TaxID=9528 RepID=H9H5K7_MACMU|nr:solute carrier family 22 member 11 isoform X1 [Macaca mulatta]XP_007991990.1 solute carrier family 22 member 11 [Chlorocebus sabaeus]XP_045227974.1 solute carrier family 22 member 11 isoform X1 [Macaca fascicularis]
MAFSKLLEQAGGMGLFQTLQVLTFILPCLVIPSQMLLENFSAAVPGHRCWTHMLDNGSAVPANMTLKALLTISIPPGPNWEPHQCRRFRQPQWQLLDPNATATSWSEADTEPCVDGWVYDRSVFTSTIVAKWDLVCSSQGLKPLSQSIFMSGILVGSFIWGLVSYRFGRKPMLSWCCLQLAVAGTSTIFAPTLVIYCGLRFVAAFGMAGILLSSLTLMVEWTMTSRRAATMTVVGCAFSAGQAALGGLAFALRDWRTLQLAASVPFFAISLISWWLPESARWLIIKGKPDQALQELRKVARINGHKEAKNLTIEVLMSSMEEEAAAAKEPRSVLDLFCVPVLRWRSCAMLVVNFSLMISYYGLVFDLQSLGRDIFLLQALFGAVDFLGRATTALLLSFLGRRTIQAGSQVMAGLAILANMLVPQDLQTLRVVFAVLGKGCFGISLTCLSIYKAELFPTPLRMTADGILHSVGRLGAMMGPLILMSRQALPLLPPLLYGVISIASSLVVLFFLPETQGLPLPDTIQDLESQKSTAAQGNRQEAVTVESTSL